MLHNHREIYQTLDLVYKDKNLIEMLIEINEVETYRILFIQSRIFQILSVLIKTTNLIKTA